MIRYLETKILKLGTEGPAFDWMVALSSPPDDECKYELHLFQHVLTATEARRLRDWLNEVVPDETQIWRPLP